MREAQEVILSCNKWLLIIPTAGYVPGTKEPTINGINRMYKAAQIARHDRSCFIAIIGNESKEYYRFLLTHYDYLNLQIAFCDASAKVTNRDIYEARQKIDSFFYEFRRSDFIPQAVRKDAKIGIVSYPWHCKRIEAILRRLGYRDITHHESGEIPCYPLPKEHFLYLITLIDPFFLWLGLPIVWLANKRK